VFVILFLIPTPDLFYGNIPLLNLGQIASARYRFEALEDNPQFHTSFLGG